MRELEPCPFCGGDASLTQNYQTLLWSLLHRCKVVGPISFERFDRARAIADWNGRVTLISEEAYDLNRLEYLLNKFEGRIPARLLERLKALGFQAPPTEAGI